nr:unnamed protein product [Callosobruchus chinensis]
MRIRSLLLATLM